MARKSFLPPSSDLRSRLGEMMREQPKAKPQQSASGFREKRKTTEQLLERFIVTAGFDATLPRGLNVSTRDFDVAQFSSFDAPSMKKSQPIAYYKGNGSDSRCQ